MKTLNRSEGQGRYPLSECSFHSESPHFLKFNLNEELEKMNQKEEQNLGTIYIATNLVNGKQYVGQTVKKLNERKSCHYNNGNYLHNAIKKYGKENFKWVSFSCLEEDMDWQETFLIKELNTLAPNGYNLDSGGNKQKHRHEITKQKLRECASGKHPSEESRQRMRESSHHLSDENNGMWGKHHSEKSIQRIRESNSGENHPRARAVILISPEGIEYKLPCYNPFCKEHNLSQGNINQVLQGKRKQHKGWTGRYLKEK